ncbi:protein FAM83F [Ictalurus punctatus]|uniref:Protein FAM83F n=1 Tax=Ictalurus punctatus TaxID=7998 RepID=A0A2D0S5S1_ICTPU|nr:protein FAM83F [Ictalurus punctatus]
MAESQLECMEDGRIGENIPESRPEFYYSETQRVALEELLKNGDGAFKTCLDKDNAKNFLSASEIKVIHSTVETYSTPDDSGAATARKHADDSTSLRSTYWPEMSDTEVPLLDIGWPNSGFFKGVTRGMVYTHPPKDNGPHIKEVVRRLIQEAHKVVAIVMDLLTDLQILQDLLDAASMRNVAVYIILDSKGGPHFLDMCRRLEVSPHHIQNIRTRMLRGVGLDLSFGRVPGSLSNKYMLIDGEKVMFGSYSFSWSSSRMDRNIITVMSGQIVDFFDRDFRELYAISRELNLFKEFSISKRNTAASTRVTVPTRPALPATSRFQVSLGDKGTLKVPAHKYHNPKYLLALGNLPDDISSPDDLINKMVESNKKYAAEGNPVEEDSEMLQEQTPSSSLKGNKGIKLSCVPSKRKKFTFQRKSKQKGTGKDVGGEVGKEDPGPSATTKLTPPTNTIEDIAESPEEPTAETSMSEKTKRKKKTKNKKNKSSQSEDQGPESHKDSKKGCAIS